MIKAIVYTSNTGHTKKYAELFAAKTGLACFSLADAKGQLQQGDEVIYFGWIMAGTISGLKKALPVCRVRAAVGVGMTEPTDEYIENVKKVNPLSDIPCFYLRGGYDLSKLRGLNKAIFNMARASEKKAGHVLPDSEDFVSEENLAALLNWFEENR